MGINWQKIWDDRGAEAWLLLPLALVYACGWLIYEAVYKFGIKKPVRPHAPVVCIGNLIVGGSGKTPLTIHVAGVIRKLGRDVVMSVNGYGSPRSSGATAAPTGELEASEWGDEAAMIRNKLPDVQLIVGQDRVRAAQICRDLYPDATLLLDDGFQHLPLAKDVTIVLDVPDYHNRFCLPSGPYREPRATGLMRADQTIPGKFTIGMESLTFYESDGSPAEITGPINALCALARPSRFVDTLEHHGNTVEEYKFFPDHDRLMSRKLLQDLNPMLPVVVTEKDWVKLKSRRIGEPWRIVIASYEVQIEPAEEFRDWLKKRLNEASN